jgi:hypothetical protein
MGKPAIEPGKTATTVLSTIRILEDYISIIFKSIVQDVTGDGKRVRRVRGKEF